MKNKQNLRGRLGSPTRVEKRRTRIVDGSNESQSWKYATNTHAVIRSKTRPYFLL